ncbi:MAG TPA: hypothetical protein VKA60_19745 [Blastocatellia bacterium]|nr:hypothetical protein [Blastocatellia bacterium]
MSNDLDIPPTQPTLETILERINTLGESLNAKIETVRVEMQSFRDEVLEKILKLDEKFEVITDELLEIKAKQKWHGKRLNELERKVS